MPIIASVLRSSTGFKVAALPLEFQREAIPAILRGIVDATYPKIFKNLSGSGASAAGSRPVPIRTGTLRRLLNRLYPGQKTNSLNEAFIVDSAIYAFVIPQAPGYMNDAVDDADNERIANDVLSKLVRF